MKKRQFTPDNISNLELNEVFVFGSNMNGNHAGGAARLAAEKFGAIDGQAEGIQGQSYAIPTLDKEMQKVSLELISESLLRFIDFAESNQGLTFYMTKIGCGIAGYDISEITTVFKKLNFPLNVCLPVEFCIIKGYKVFNPNFSCRGFQYELGCDYSTDKEIECCGHGFHFCESLIECYEYYSFKKENKVAEVDVLGYTLTDDGKKFCTNHIKIGRELSWEEVDSLVNIGTGNTGKGNSGDLNSGDRNSGDLNSGYRNSGYLNSGDRNSGDRNSGDLNSGDRNSGDLNSGDRNSGDRNSGDRNSGYRNSGDLNSGYRNSGVFCNRKRESKVIIFNKESDMTWDEWYNHEAYNLSSRLTITKWIDWDDMSEELKIERPKAFVTGGYLKVFGYKEAWKNLWDSFNEEQKNVFKSLPNFDSDVFLYITGIDLR